MLRLGRRRGLLAINAPADDEKLPGDRVTRALTLDPEGAGLALLPLQKRDVVEWAISQGFGSRRY